VCRVYGVFRVRGGRRLSRELHEKKGWLQLCVVASLLKELFCFLDETVKYADDGAQKAASAIQDQIYYQMQILELLKLLIESYEPHRMPPGFMADWSASRRSHETHPHGARVTRVTHL
jgi:hypothetical protein